MVRTNVPRHIDFTYSSNTNHIQNIKSFILSSYNSSLTNVVLIIGHAPIPYSGTIPSDGHSHTSSTPGHEGAWTADAYYGNVNNAAWTDTASAPNLDYPQNSNSSGDGKFDNDFLPLTGNAPLQLAVGRIDFSNLSAFTNKTETTLTQQYLTKNNRYRTGQMVLNDRTTVGGFFGLPSPNEHVYDHRNDNTFHNARKNATRWFGIGPGKLVHADIFQQTAATYLWGFMGGSGGILHIVGDGGAVSSTFTLADPTKEPQAAFYWLHGSWFADWNLTATNNFVRACLATPNYGLAATALSQVSLTSFAFENLALGEPLANGMLRTGVVLSNRFPRWLTIIGDPTLRLKMPAPPSSFTVSSMLNLSWAAVPNALNYYVYRSTNTGSAIDGPWTRFIITSSTSCTDPNPQGAKLYMVRATLLTTTGSGSYTNLTQGVFAAPN